MQRLTVSALTAAALIGGYGVARATGVRWLGGVVLGGLAATSGVLVGRSGGPGRAAAVAGAAVVAFGASHPLAKRLGAWPSVLAVTAAAVVPAALLTPAGRR